MFHVKLTPVPGIDQCTRDIRREHVIGLAKCPARREDEQCGTRGVGQRSIDGNC